MPRQNLDSPSDHDQFKPKKRMGWMGGFSHIFERKSKPANQHKSLHSEGGRACYSMDPGSKDYIYLSSEFPNSSIETSSQPKKSASLKKFFRSSSFDSSHLQSKISDCQDSLQLSKELSEYKEMLDRSSCLWESARLSKNDEDLQFPAPDKEAGKKQSFMRRTPLGGGVSLGSSEDFKELNNRKTRPPYSVRSKNVFDQALDVKHFDDLNNPSTPHFESRILQKHIQETNDLVVSWLDSQKQLKKLDDLRDSLRGLDKLKDQEWNNCNTAPACRRSLNFKKPPSFSEQNHGTHGFEDSTHVRVLVNFGGSAATRKEPLGNFQSPKKNTLGKNGSTHERKPSSKAAKDSQEPVQYSLEGRSSNLRFYNEIFSQVGLQKNDFPINIAEKLKETKSSTRSICTSDPGILGHVDNLPSKDDLGRSEGKNQAPSVIARLMGLDAMPVPFVPETVTKPLSDSELQKEALQSQPHEVLSNLQQTQFYEVSKESSLDNNLQIHSSIQSAKGNIPTSIVEKQNPSKKDKEMEPLSELESSCTQIIKEAPQSTWKNRGDTNQSFPAPKHIIHAAAPLSEKTIHSEILSPPRQKEQTVVDGKLKHEIRKSNSKYTVYEDLENRIRQMQVQDSLDGHKTLKEILETMQLKGLLHIPSLNRVQTTKEKHQHENLSVEQEHRMNTSISNVNVQDSVGSCQSLQLADHLKAYANESFYKVKCDSGDFKKSPIVLIKPISSPNKTKLALLANDGLTMAVKSSLSTKNICKAHGKQGGVKRQAFRKRVHNSLSKTSSFKSHRTSESTCNAWNSERNEKVSSNRLYEQDFTDSQEAYHKEQADSLTQLPQFSPKVPIPQPPSSNAPQQFSHSYKSGPGLIENSKASVDQNYPFHLSESSSKKMSSVKLEKRSSSETTLHHETTSNEVSNSLEADTYCSMDLPVTPQKVKQSDIQNRECIDKLQITSLQVEILDAPKFERIEQEIKASQTLGLKPEQAVLAPNAEVHSDSVKPSLQQLVLLNPSTLDCSATLLNNSPQDTELEPRDMHPERQGKGSFLKSSIQKELSQRPNASTVNVDVVAIPNRCIHSAFSESEALLQARYSRTTGDFPERESSLLRKENLVATKLPTIHLQGSSTLPISNEAPIRGLYQTIQNQQFPEGTVGRCLQTPAIICQEIMFTATELQQSDETLPKEPQPEHSISKPATSTLGATSHPIHIHPSKDDQVAFDITKMQASKKKNYPEALTLEHAAKRLLGALSADSERPSPISVLESHFLEDEHLIDTTRFSSLSHENQAPTFDVFLEDYSVGRLSNKFLKELQLLEVDSKLEADNIPGMVYATFQTDNFLKRCGNASKDHQQAKDGLIETESGAFQWSQNKEMASIRDILETPDLEQVDVVFTPSKFPKTQGQDLAIEVDQSLQEEKIKKSKLQVNECRLHFECLNETIAKNLLPFVYSQPWVPLQKPVLRRKPSEEQLVQQARKEIKELPCFPATENSSIDMLYTILEGDSAQAQWLYLKADILEIGLSLASLILNETVTETICDLVHLARGESRIP
ncbi:hypothetical protein O6H91_01G069900 [Diphasiastrum complanatum]|uniref:Uncharacterized protein n=1 Tax=Diphasiastrum complanatum TaxID=34168 RepID=A0ACC2ES34_DIPCM|nr:hypothetical protein O6H91_01G069900 [Diphasiastrum complanatum]